MARLARAEVFAADEIAIVHVMNRVVRRCFLMGPIDGPERITTIASCGSNNCSSTSPAASAWIYWPSRFFPTTFI